MSLGKAMTIAVRSIYYKAVTPSFRILNLDDGLWFKWLYCNNHKRIQIYKNLTNVSSDIREIAWIPLEGIPESKKEELIFTLSQL